MGVHSLKIEGRTKSFYYCAHRSGLPQGDRRCRRRQTVRYQPAGDRGLAHRGYTEGFLRRHTHDDYQNYEYGYSVSERQQFVGEFTGERNARWRPWRSK